MNCSGLTICHQCGGPCATDAFHGLCLGCASPQTILAPGPRQVNVIDSAAISTVKGGPSTVIRYQYSGPEDTLG